MAATHGVHVGKTRPLTGWRAGGRAAYYPPWNCPFFFHDSLGDEATRVFSPSSHAFVKRFHPILVFPSIRGEIENRTKFLFFFFFGNKRFSWIDFKKEGSATISSKQIVTFPVHSWRNTLKLSSLRPFSKILSMNLEMEKREKSRKGKMTKVLGDIRLG